MLGTYSTLWGRHTCKMNSNLGAHRPQQHPIVMAAAHLQCTLRPTMQLASEVVYVTQHQPLLEVIATQALWFTGTPVRCCMAVWLRNVTEPADVNTGDAYRCFTSIVACPPHQVSVGPYAAIKAGRVPSRTTTLVGPGLQVSLFVMHSGLGLADYTV
jgi:hypothetical protein